MGGNECAVQAPMLNQKLNELEDLVERAYSKLEVLFERLAPVCTPPQPTAQAVAAGEPVQSMSTFAQNIQSRNGELRVLCNKMDYLLSILEV